MFPKIFSSVEEKSVRIALADAQGDIAVNSKKITSAADPVAAQDLATKAFGDEVIFLELTAMIAFP